MTLQEAIVARHSVRQYIEKPIEAEKVQQLQTLIGECQTRPRYRQMPLRDRRGEGEFRMGVNQVSPRIAWIGVRKRYYKICCTNPK